MLYICIFSNKFDLKQTIRVLHITSHVIMLSVSTTNVSEFSLSVLTAADGLEPCTLRY
jgi:hypothetical protein